MKKLGAKILKEQDSTEWANLAYAGLAKGASTPHTLFSIFEPVAAGDTLKF